MDPHSATAYLGGLIGYEQSGRVTHPTTDRIATLAAALGNPHRSYPVIHVTGTNGKGSTTAMIAALLAAHGLRVGTFTSPHLRHLGERITVDGRPAHDEALADAIGQVADAAARTGITPSWFEAVTAAGLWLLASGGVDVAVVEVGMLGRWDATNIVDATIAVVTNVQLDHTELAGPTRAAIAWEKAGIVKPGAVLILGEQDPALRPIFEARHPGRILTQGRELFRRNRRSAATGSVVDLINPWGNRAGVHVGMVGDHQCDNALLALSAAEAFTGVAMARSLADATLAHTQVPGRFETWGHDPPVILDGAHNPAGADALRLALGDTVFAAEPRILLFGATAGGNPVEFLDRLDIRDVDLVVATEPGSPRALNADALAEAARGFGVRARSVPVPERALEVAMAEGGVVVATGSLYLIGALQTAIEPRVVSGLTMKPTAVGGNGPVEPAGLLAA
jgi:dihydrofolate synthase/folylpolyglutamate synthase